MIIKELRKDKQISQSQLADILGVSQSAIAKWELEKTEPTASAILKAAEYFNVTTDIILGKEQDSTIQVLLSKNKHNGHL